MKTPDARSAAKQIMLMKLYQWQICGMSVASARRMQALSHAAQNMWLIG